MLPSQPSAPTTYNGLASLQLKKVSLEKAEAALLSFYQTEIRRMGSRQLASMNKNKEGRPFSYAKTLIEYAALILYLRNLSYRRLEEELFLRIEIRISKSQLQERITKLIIDIGNFVGDKLLNVAMDATGFKPTNKGDWRILNHENGEVKRDGYIKLMAGIDMETLTILTGFIGDAQTADITLFRPAFNEVKDKAKALFGDGSFDAFEVYRRCSEAGITPIVKPDKNAIIRYNKQDLPRELRSYYVSFIKKWGYKEWSKRFGYGRRWLIEIVFSKFKRLFGEVMRSKKEENIAQEFTIKIWIYNALTALERGYNIFCLFFIRIRASWRTVYFLFFLQFIFNHFLS